jgi:hypothetical protein
LVLNQLKIAPATAQIAYTALVGAAHLEPHWQEP